jgi:hypothetical protein
MLNEKQFRERARSELRQVGDQLLSLATDRDVYRKMEREIVQHNPQLHGQRSPFLDMLRGCYADAMAARILRLLDSNGISLPSVLAKLAEHQPLLRDKVTEREFNNDRAALLQAATNIQRALVPHCSHHERTLSALASLHRELDAALDLMMENVQTYYWVVADSYIDLKVKHDSDPLAVFQFSWATPVLAT